jgi:hypothetical protein
VKTYYARPSAAAVTWPDMAGDARRSLKPDEKLRSTRNEQPLRYMLGVLVSEL